jgi:predicted nucleic acid-binding Zn ribbon protein
MINKNRNQWRSTNQISFHVEQIDQNDQREYATQCPRKFTKILRKKKKKKKKFFIIYIIFIFII